MGNSTALGLASFATGFLGGMNDRRAMDQKNAVMAEELAWKREQRQAERDKLASEREYRASLADAVKPARVDTGYQVTDAAGSDAFTKDADAAAMMSDMSASREQAPSLSSATRVQDTAYSDPRQAKAAQAEYNSQPAMLDRMATATMPHDPTKGMGLQSAAAKARDGISDAQKKQQSELDERFNVEVASIANSRPDWWVAAAEMATNSKFGPIKDIKVSPVMSEDGKSVKFVAESPDGKKQTMGEFTADEAGAQKWVQASAKVDAKTKLGWLADRAKHLQKMDEERAKAGRPEKAPSGYQWNGESLQPIPGGPADPATKTAGGLNSMDRLLIDGRRKEAKSAIEAIQERLSDRRLNYQAKTDPDAKSTIDGLKRKLAEAEAEFKRWDGAMSELATSALGRAAPTGLGGYRKEANLKSLAAGNMGSDPAAIARELAAARADLSKVPDESSKQMLQDYIQQLEGQQSRLGLSSAEKPRGASSGPVQVTTKEEHAALPKGTRYIAPNGETYIKR
jgi:hypothetical protein